MIKLYGFLPYYGLPDPSPFVLKVECYLRAAGIEFEMRYGAQHLRSAPKGKLPYIDDDGEIVADSAFILAYLKKKYGDRLDGSLSADQAAVAHAFIKMMDEDLYWCLVHTRWIGEDMWPTVRQDFFGKLPWPVRIMVPALARRSVRRTLYLQGLGRHSGAEILGIAKRDLAALSHYLGEEEYFLGDHPTTLDVAAYAFLAEITVPPFTCALNETARSFDNLVEFVNRIREKYYPVVPGTHGNMS